MNYDGGGGGDGGSVVVVVVGVVVGVFMIRLSASGWAHSGQVSMSFTSTCLVLHVTIAPVQTVVPSHRCCSDYYTF